MDNNLVSKSGPYDDGSIIQYCEEITVYCGY